jgi:uncharacterized membrane protein YhaH (DUF805 family)
MRWVTRPWRQAFNFTGRATRREYWLFQVQILVLYVGLVVAMGVAAEGSGSDAADAAMAAATLLLICLFTIVALAAGVRRVHDHDKTGWLFLLSFIPLIGWVFFLIMMLTPGTKGENSYGYDPREGDHLSPEEVASVFS